MDIPKDYLKTLQSGKTPLKTTSERQELIQRFVDRINPERIHTAFKPATWKQINGLCAHLNERDLYWLLVECEKAKNFSRKFFGVLKGARVSKKS